MTTYQNILQFAAVSATLALAACGGGGGDGGGGSSAPTSYWMMNSFTYVNGGTSAQTSNVVGGQVQTAVAVSTATANGGDKSNGAYSGSSLSFVIKSTAPGTYNVVSSVQAMANVPSSMNPIYVQCLVGANTTTGSTLYAASTGQVIVTVDSNGKLHFRTDAAIPTAKLLDTQGGVAGAPTTMNLTIVDAF